MFIKRLRLPVRRKVMSSASRLEQNSLINICECKLTYECDLYLGLFCTFGLHATENLNLLYEIKNNSCATYYTKPNCSLFSLIKCEAHFW